MIHLHSTNSEMKSDSLTPSIERDGDYERLDVRRSRLSKMNNGGPSVIQTHAVITTPVIPFMAHVVDSQIS